MKTLREHARARLRDERGVAALEFAIVAQLLMILLYGMLSYGFVFAADHNMAQAAAEGARATISQSSTDPIILAKYAHDQAQSRLTFQLVHDNANVFTEVVPCPSDSSVNCIHVRITYDYSSHPIIPSFLLGGLLPSTLTDESYVEL